MSKLTTIVPALEDLGFKVIVNNPTKLERGQVPILEIQIQSTRKYGVRADIFEHDTTLRIRMRWSDQKLDLYHPDPQQILEHARKLAKHREVLESFITVYDDLRGKKTR